MMIMGKVLYVTANPKSPERSRGLAVGQAFIEAYREARPEDEIVHLDLFRDDIPTLDIDVFNGWDKLSHGEELTSEERRKVERINELTDQFVAADKYVFVSPLWNLSIPPILKTYIDNICVAGKTFKYTENGPVGLLQGKKAIHIQASGGIYSRGPAREMEFGNRYLTALLRFMGVTDVDSIFVEGMDYNPADADRIVQEAIEEARAKAKAFAGDPVRV
jgi:FMN-dependent NADH-azoreductase